MNLYPAIDLKEGKCIRLKKGELEKITFYNQDPIDQADQLFKDQKFDDSMKIFEQLVIMDPGNSKIIVGLLRCMIQLKLYDESKELFESLDENVSKDSEVLKIKKLLDNMSIEKNNLSYYKLEELVQNEPQNKDLRFKLAESYLSATETEKGFNELLKLFEQDSKWNDSAAKKKLLEYFDLLGFNDPNVMDARKKLSSMMFK